LKEAKSIPLKHHTNTNVPERSLSWLDTYTAIKSGGVKLVINAFVLQTTRRKLKIELSGSLVIRWQKFLVLK